MAHLYATVWAGCGIQLFTQRATCGAGRIGPIECWVYLETSDHRIPYKNSGKRKYHDKCAEVFIDVELTVPVNMHTTFGSTLDGGRFVRGRYFTV